MAASREFEGLVVDLFAGGGGASTGIEAALGRPVDIALNHDAVALAVHKANHPQTQHFEQDIWAADPSEATGGRRVALLWASPDCTHFSQAKGGKPRSQKLRTLAWAVVKWAAATKPTVIFLENVTEFQGWGPLKVDGTPDKRCMGQTFREWTRKLEKLGYVVECRVLDASLYGAPTRRKRLFIIARRDGRPIVWPTVTHGPGKLPVHTAAECIDWSLDCPSIFDRNRPLADKTQWRIAQGMKRFVIENPRPFLVKVNHGKADHRTESLDEPLTTVTATQRGHALVTPFLAGVGGRMGQSPERSVDRPLHTVTAKADTVVIAPTLVQVNHGVDARTGRREHSVEQPLGVITAGGGSHALAAATLIQTGYGEREGQAARVPGIEKPLGTVVAGGQKHALVAAFLSKHFGGVVGHEVTREIGTITSRDHHALTSACLVKLRGQCNGSGADEPLPTLTSGGTHLAEVRAFLLKYYGTARVGQSVEEPLHTLTAKDRLGLVTIEGSEYAIADIGMRMLEPHELLRRQFGKYAASYDMSAAKTKSAKVRLIGNSVCPEVAEAIVRSNIAPARAAQVAA